MKALSGRIHFRLSADKLKQLKIKLLKEDKSLTLFFNEVIDSYLTKTAKNKP